MALSITQTPATCSLAQSPIIFTLAESTPVYTSSSFQYVGELYYWTGSLTSSSSIADYTIVKFPNTADVGIFDLNRIINSTLTPLAIANTSSVSYFAVDFYFQYQSGSIYVTGSHLRSSTYKALDGYGLFPEAIGQQIFTSSVFWPLMTDGPATQSCFDTNVGISGIYTGDVGATVPTKIVYTSNLGTANYNVSSSLSSSGQIYSYPIGPAQSGFPLSTSGIQYFSVQAFNGATALGNSILYNLICQQKYPNVRIKWKNRFGQFDYLNFDMVNRQSMSTTKRSYQPQIGSFTQRTLSYNEYDTQTLNYVVDANQIISCNTNWLSEDYNDILKQLLVSDEIYWMQYNTAAVKPLTIVTSNIQFKTGVVDKLIQYQFDFQFGQGYKLII